MQRPLPAARRGPQPGYDDNGSCFYADLSKEPSTHCPFDKHSLSPTVALHCALLMTTQIGAVLSFTRSLSGPHSDPREEEDNETQFTCFSRPPRAKG